MVKSSSSGKNGEKGKKGGLEAGLINSNNNRVLEKNIIVIYYY